MEKAFYIDPDIRKAETLPARFYRDKQLFEQLKNNVFAKTWQFVGDAQNLQKPGDCAPTTLLGDFVSEPLLLMKDSSTIRCLSNVCTHRANLLVDHNKNTFPSIICDYHGRRFNIEGKMEYMPGFKDALDFPRPCDHLKSFPLKQWGPLLFVGLEPVFHFQTILDIMEERIGFLNIQDFIYDPTASKDYKVNAHWALYCDNYLEGFHIPFVHKGLNEVLDYSQYETLLFDHCNLQIGYSDDADSCFEFPEGHIDYGKKIAAYYFWIFPNLMFNFYPWGLSINRVIPVNTQHTKVQFLSYICDPSKMHMGASGDLDKVEQEDERVVENVAKGLQSNYYKTGRFSPTKEQGVHHFHKLLADFVLL